MKLRISSNSNSRHSNNWAADSRNEKHNVRVYQDPISSGRPPFFLLGRPPFFRLSSAKLDVSGITTLVSRFPCVRLHMRILRLIVGRQRLITLRRRLLCALNRVTYGAFNADTIRRVDLSKGVRAPSIYGVDAHSEMFAVSGADGGDCGEGTGAADMGFAIAKFRHSCAPGDLGVGGGGFAGVTCFKTDEVKVEGAAKLFDISDGSTPEGHSSRRVESGCDSAIGAKLRARIGAPGEGVRTKGSGSFISKNCAAKLRDFGSSVPPESFAYRQSANPQAARGP